jgi:hypothetical protein
VAGTKVEKLFPSIEELTALVPEGRRPYFAARVALRTVVDPTNDPNNQVSSALWDVAEANRQRILDPPLPVGSDLETSVYGAASYLDDGGFTWQEGYSPQGALFLLDVIVEYGYYR